MSMRDAVSPFLDDLRQGQARKRRRRAEKHPQVDIVTLDGVSMDEFLIVLPEDEFDNDEPVRIPILRGGK